MFDNLTNQNLLEDMLADYSITSLKYRYYSREYIWQKWIRS